MVENENAASARVDESGGADEVNEDLSWWSYSTIYSRNYSFVDSLTVNMAVTDIFNLKELTRETEQCLSLRLFTGHQQLPQNGLSWSNTDQVKRFSVLPCFKASYDWTCCITLVIVRIGQALIRENSTDESYHVHLILVRADICALVTSPAQQIVFRRDFTHV